MSTKYTLRGKSAAWVLPLTLVSGKIDAIGTVKKYDAISDPLGTCAASKSASTTNVYSAVAANGVTLQANKNDTVLDILTLAPIAAGAGGSPDTIAFGCMDTGLTNKQFLKALRGLPALVCIPLAQAVDGAEDGFAYLIGNLSSDVVVGEKAETIGVQPVTFSGQSYALNSGRTNVLLEVAFAAITPVGETATITPHVLVSADVDALLTGQLLITGTA